MRDEDHGGVTNNRTSTECLGPVRCHHVVLRDSHRGSAARAARTGRSQCPMGTKWLQPTWGISSPNWPFLYFPDISMHTHWLIWKLFVPTEHRWETVLCCKQVGYCAHYTIEVTCDHFVFRPLELKLSFEWRWQWHQSSKKSIKKY